MEEEENILIQSVNTLAELKVDKYMQQLTDSNKAVQGSQIIAPSQEKDDYVFGSQSNDSDHNAEGGSQISLQEEEETVNLSPVVI